LRGNILLNGCQAIMECIKLASWGHFVSFGLRVKSFGTTATDLNIVFDDERGGLKFLKILTLY
jgi:hypothetical protein